MAVLMRAASIAAAILLATGTWGSVGAASPRAAAFHKGYELQRVTVTYHGRRCQALLTGNNDRDEVVGASTCTKTAFIRHRNGKLQLIRRPSEKRFTVVPSGISNNGAVVLEGFSKKSSGFTSWLRQPDGRLKRIADPQASSGGTAAQSVNSSGVVVGAYAYNSPMGPAFHGFIDRRGTYRTFRLPGYQRTFLTAISDDGNLSGYATTADGSNRGFVMIDGRVHMIRVRHESFGANLGLFVDGINDAGDTVGTVFEPGKQHRTFGFIMVGGAVREIRRPGKSVYLSGINDDDEFVGAVTGNRPFGFIGRLRS